MSDSDLARFSALGATAFGVAGLLAPLFGSRTLMIGALALAESSEETRQRVLVLGAAMNAADALSAVANRGLPTRTRVMGGMTSGGFAALMAYAAST